MLVAALMRLLSLCWSPVDASNGGSGDDDGGAGRERIDGLLRYRDIGQYAFGDFSMAVVQGNQVLEDQCRIESGPFGAFVGVYDGHGGPEAARYACDHLHSNFRGKSSDDVGLGNFFLISHINTFFTSKFWIHSRWFTVMDN